MSDKNLCPVCGCKMRSGSTCGDPYIVCDNTECVANDKKIWLERE